MSASMKTQLTKTSLGDFAGWNNYNLDRSFLWEVIEQGVVSETAVKSFFMTDMPTIFHTNPSYIKMEHEVQM